MRRVAAHMLLGCAVILAASSRAAAQDERPRIGPIAIDVRGTFPGLPVDPALAASRGLLPDELPDRGLGLDVGGHVYLVTWKAVTVGVGAQLMMLRAAASPPSDSTLRAVTGRLTSFAPQVSLNFGTGDGWSYLSGGLGSTRWSIVPDGQPDMPPDGDRVRTINYGAGARWFATAHVAFTFDVRFHVIAAGPLHPTGLPGTPSTRLFVMGAGISIK